MLKKVVFIDRDGVINRDSPDYIKTWSEFDFLPGSLDALAHLSKNECTVIIITNQSAIDRRLTSLQAVENIHERMRSVVSARGGEIRDIFFCPHTPEAQCECRKPKPGMILQATALLRQNPEPSFAEIIDAMEDNLCRCGAHNRIVQAIQAAALEMKGGR